MELVILIVVGIAVYFFLIRDGGDRAVSKPSSQKVKPYKTSRQSGHRSKEYETPLVLANKRLIEQSIIEGKRLRFEYIDKHGEMTTRSVSPHEIFDYNFNDGKGHMMCLSAHCHLRGADRTFALFRMRRVEIL